MNLNGILWIPSNGYHKQLVLSDCYCISQLSLDLWGLLTCRLESLLHFTRLFCHGEAEGCVWFYWRNLVNMDSISRPGVTWWCASGHCLWQIKVPISSYTCIYSIPKFPPRFAKGINYNNFSRHGKWRFGVNFFGLPLCLISSWSAYHSIHFALCTFLQSFTLQIIPPVCSW